MIETIRAARERLRRHREGVMSRGPGQMALWRAPLLLACAFLAAYSQPTHAQQAAADAAVAEAAQAVLKEPSGADWSLSGGNGWTLALAPVSQGDEKRLYFHAEIGRRYMVVGAGSRSVVDLDLCVGDTCNLLPHATPSVDFVAGFTGRHMAVLSVSDTGDESISGGVPAFAGLAVLDHNDPDDGGGLQPPGDYDAGTFSVVQRLTAAVNEGWQMFSGDGDDASGWGLVAGAFGEGDERDLTFRAEQGEHYEVVGAGSEASLDLDLVVFDESGTKIAEDVRPDATAEVSIVAPTTGIYTAWLMAYAGSSAPAGMNETTSTTAGLVLLRRGALPCDAWRSDAAYFSQALVVDVADCVDYWYAESERDAAYARLLPLAARDSKHAEVVEMLLDMHNPVFESGQTPLELAVAHSPIPDQVVRLLLEYNPEWLIPPEQGTTTPLHLAVGQDEPSVAVIQTLLEDAALLNVDPDVLTARDSLGDTPLHVAARFATRPVIVRELVEFANGSTRKEILTATNNDGKTPVELASERKRGFRVAGQLEEYDGRYVNPSLGSRVRVIADYGQRFATPAIMMLFAFIRTFPNTGFSRRVYAAINPSPPDEPGDADAEPEFPLPADLET